MPQNYKFKQADTGVGIIAAAPDDNKFPSGSSPDSNGWGLDFQFGRDDTVHIDRSSIKAIQDTQNSSSNPVIASKGLFINIASAGRLVVDPPAAADKVTVSPDFLEVGGTRIQINSVARGAEGPHIEKLVIGDKEIDFGNRMRRYDEIMSPYNRFDRTPLQEQEAQNILTGINKEVQQGLEAARVKPAPQTAPQQYSTAPPAAPEPPSRQQQTASNPDQRLRDYVNNTGSDERLYNKLKQESQQDPNFAKKLEILEKSGVNIELKDRDRSRPVEVGKNVFYDGLTGNHYQMIVNPQTLSTGTFSVTDTALQELTKAKYSMPLAIAKEGRIEQNLSGRRFEEASITRTYDGMARDLQTAQEGSRLMGQPPRDVMKEIRALPDGNRIAEQINRASLRLGNPPLAGETAPRESAPLPPVAGTRSGPTYAETQIAARREAIAQREALDNKPAPAQQQTAPPVVPPQAAPVTPPVSAPVSPPASPQTAPPVAPPQARAPAVSELDLRLHKFVNSAQSDAANDERASLYFRLQMEARKDPDFSRKFEVVEKSGMHVNFHAEPGQHSLAKGNGGAYEMNVNIKSVRNADFSVIDTALQDLAKAGVNVTLPPPKPAAAAAGPVAPAARPTPTETVSVAPRPKVDNGNDQTRLNERIALDRQEVAQSAAVLESLNRSVRDQGAAARPPQPAPQQYPAAPQTVARDGPPPTPAAPVPDPRLATMDPDLRTAIAERLRQYAAVLTPEAKPSNAAPAAATPAAPPPQMTVARNEARMKAEAASLDALDRQIAIADAAQKQHPPQQQQPSGRNGMSSSYAATLDNEPASPMKNVPARDFTQAASTPEGFLTGMKAALTPMTAPLPAAEAVKQIQNGSMFASAGYRSDALKGLSNQILPLYGERLGDDAKLSRAEIVQSIAEAGLLYKLNPAASAKIDPALIDRAKAMLKDLGIPDKIDDQTKNALDGIGRAHPEARDRLKDPSLSEGLARAAIYASLQVQFSPQQAAQAPATPQEQVIAAPAVRNPGNAGPG